MSSIDNVILIGTLRTGGAESAVRAIAGRLSEPRRGRTMLVVVNDPQAIAFAGEVGMEVMNLAAGSLLGAACRLRRLLASRSVRCVHAHLTQCIIMAGLAAAGTAVRVVPYIHTFGSWKQAPRLRDRLRIACERLVVNRRAEHVVYVSQRTRTLHERRLGYRSDIACVIPNLVCREFRHAPADDGTLKLVSVGRVEKVKGFDWVLELAGFDEIFCGVRWTIVGDGGHLAALKEKAAELGRWQVSFVGGQSDVAPYLAAADVFFMPSLSEGLPVAMLEAAKAAMPLLATNVGSISEIVQHGRNGLLLDVGDEQALREALAALRRPTMRKSMGQCSGRIFSEHFDPQQLIQQIEALMV